MSFATSLDGSVPTQLRGLAWLSLSATGHVLNLVTTTDSGGGSTRTWTTGAAIPCRVDSLGGSEAPIADRVSDRSTHLITVPPATAIGHEDRFTVDSDTYEITAVRESTREWLRTLEAVKLG